MKEKAAEVVAAAQEKAAGKFGNDREKESKPSLRRNHAQRPGKRFVSHHSIDDLNDPLAA